LGPNDDTAGRFGGGKNGLIQYAGLVFEDAEGGADKVLSDVVWVYPIVGGVEIAGGGGCSSTVIEGAHEVCCDKRRQEDEDSEDDRRDGAYYDLDGG
jgi:hypothetical protein